MLDIKKAAAVAEANLAEQFRRAEEICELNTEKVLKAFWDNYVSEAMLHGTTGYGYDDKGRDVLDAVFAQAFGAEDALVRSNFISGTHTLSTALFGILRPGDTMYSVSGAPYDTLLEAIGISGEAGNGSLADFGIKYRQTELKPDGTPDYDEINRVLAEDKSIKLVFIQRSRGYTSRATLPLETIGEICKNVKTHGDIPVMVDNCYGEFVREKEPLAVGADLIAGSLIKNPGGGIARTGGYIAGKKKLVELCAYRLTSVGIGKECGASLNENRNMFQGFFYAPHTVCQAVKTALFAAELFGSLGFDVSPTPSEPREDIIQSLILRDPDLLLAFCCGIQHGAPIDSYVTPEPWAMPGYSDEVVMAAGAFVQGASIELSADAPMKDPYIAYMQGGLTYHSGKIAVMKALEEVLEYKGKKNG